RRLLVLPPLRRPPKEGPPTRLIRFSLAPNALLHGTNPLILLRELLELGTGSVRADASAVPPLDEIDAERSLLTWEVTLTSDASNDEIEGIFLFVRQGMELSITPVEAATPPAALAPPEPRHAEAIPTPAPEPATAPPPAVREENRTTPSSDREAPAASLRPTADSAIKVSADRIDNLMNQVGELVITQSRLKQFAHSEEELSRATLHAITEEMGRLVSELRDTTMSIRMVPIGSLFGRFRRLVRDLSREMGKQVELVTHGEETELDKTMVENLNDPLIHLIRNAIDHGLESPEERRAAGKPEQGTLILAADHFGGQVHITVSDDGRGMNRSYIRTKAEERGLLAPGSDIPDAELLAMIFQPGFSTAPQVTSLSGRGVGMDVVKKNIDALRGVIDLWSAPGEGSDIVLRLPLTLAIIDGLLVQVDAGRFIIPLSAVDAIVERDESEPETSEGNRFLYIRDELVPYLQLRELFSIPGEAPLREKVVIVLMGERRVGLVVDRILGDHQTVIKSLSRLHADIHCFSGATILGDGSVALILDIGHLVDLGQHYEEGLRLSRGYAA
ncbi:MAG: chemotaxis protein CheA, partial [Magnetococcales bacterium]|nr:chemotaxis protein CheA [Magnetococcales bacterium]